MATENQDDIADNDQEDIEDRAEDREGKLTDWKNEPKLADLKQHLEDSRGIHEAQKRKIRDWLDNMHVRGSAAIKKVEGSSSIQPKLIRKQAEWRYANLSEPFLSSPDVFNVQPVTWEDKAGAEQNQLVLNYQFNTKLNKQDFIDEYVRTAVDEGTVIVKLGWKSKEAETTSDQPTIQYIVDPEFAPAIEHLKQLKVQDPVAWMELPEEFKRAVKLSEQQGSPVKPQVVGYGPKANKKMVINQPTLEVVDFANIIMDPLAYGKVDDMRFIIHSCETDLASLKEDGRYKRLDMIRPDTNSLLSEPDHEFKGRIDSFNFADKPRTKFVMFEFTGFWDIHGDGTLEPIIASWVGDTLIRMELLPFPDKKLPYVVVKYLPVRKSNYGEPDGELLEDNQKILGALYRGMIDLMGKSANGQTGMRKDMLDPVNRRKFLKGEDYEFNLTTDPRQGIYQHTYPEIPQSALVMTQMMNQDAESLTGVRSFSTGVGSQSLGDVAAGIRGALDAASKRELGILRRLSAGMVEIGRKIIAMNAVFLSETEVIRVTNDEFVPVDRDDLMGDYDLSLSISTAEEDNNKAEQLAFLLQTVGPNTDIGMVKMILSDIAKLRKMPDLAKRILDYNPQPDPVAQKMQELEMAKIDAEIAEIKAKTQKTLVDANLSQAKANEHSAKTDKINLDYVEQESGTTQERDLQKQGEQARAQTGLALVKHSMDLRKEAIKAFNSERIERIKAAKSQ